MTVILDDRSAYEPVSSAICWPCRHFREGSTPTCDAFPDGIPAVIWRGENNHTAAFPGDHGIQFAPIEESE